MLVLTRHPQESIIIGKNLVKIKVLEVNGQSVRIGIEAPDALSIHREEIYHRINGNTEYVRPPRPVQAVKSRVERTIAQPEDFESVGNN